MPRVDLALRIGEHLAMLGSDHRGQRSAWRSSSSLNLNMTRAQRRGGVADRRRIGGRLDRGVDLDLGGMADTGAPARWRD
jgi:hypothetical protein